MYHFFRKKNLMSLSHVSMDVIGTFRRATARKLYYIAWLAVEGVLNVIT